MSDRTPEGAHYAGQQLVWVRRDVAARLASAGIDAAAADARLLLAHVRASSPAEVDVDMALGATLSEGQAGSLATAVGRRINRIPLQHITGIAYFADVELAVGPGVFVPRPETEALYEWAAQQVIAMHTRREGAEALTVIDLCAGSGALACAVALRFPQAEVHAVELSDDALPYLQTNAERYGVTAWQGDVTGELPAALRSADIVVANPPYIPPDAIPVTPEVAEHDPAIALYGLGDDGLAIPQATLACAAQLLRPGGCFGVEHADCQQLALIDMARAYGVGVQGHRDLNGRPRFITGRAAG